MFSVFFLKNGGGSARNIDIAGSVLKRAQRNYRLNSLNADSRDFVKEDSLKWIRYAEKKGLRFSMAVFDPPSFARSKKGHFSVRRDYLSSLEILGNICPGGAVLTAVNSHSVPLEEYMEMHPRGWKNLFIAHEASDFRNDGRPYLKTGLWRVPA
jgi:23S rRNA (cytosine1962-C5)-methyltransferase